MTRWQASVTKAPFELLRGRNGSCTSMAVFLTAALRSVGVPARIAGTPQWNVAKSLSKLAQGNGFQVRPSHAVPTHRRRRTTYIHSPLLAPPVRGTDS